jgi:hypothetical protein
MTIGLTTLAVLTIIAINENPPGVTSDIQRQKKISADPEAAARKLVEISNSIEPAQDGRIFIERINGPMLSSTKRRLLNTKPGLILQSHAAGWSCTKEVPLYASDRSARICSHDGRVNL